MMFPDGWTTAPKNPSVLVRIFEYSLVVGLNVRQFALAPDPVPGMNTFPFGSSTPPPRPDEPICTKEYE